jgi:catechol 2,3-dioxygenase-like lactoylglutathione lyase family enzyme
MNTTAKGLAVTEIKAFVPAKDFDLSLRFYQDLGFTLASNESGIAYFHCNDCSFLLQDFYVQALADNFMMHLLTEDVDAWWIKVAAADIAAKYEVRVTPVVLQPWGMRDFTVTDPSGVLWHIGENAPKRTA